MERRIEECPTCRLVAVHYSIDECIIALKVELIKLGARGRIHAKYAPDEPRPSRREYYREYYRKNLAHPRIRPKMTDKERRAAKYASTLRWEAKRKLKQEEST